MNGARSRFRQYRTSNLLGFNFGRQNSRGRFLETGYIQERYIELGNKELDIYWQRQEGTFMKGGTNQRSWIQQTVRSGSSGLEYPLGRY